MTPEVIIVIPSSSPEWLDVGFRTFGPKLISIRPHTKKENTLQLILLINHVVLTLCPWSIAGFRKLNSIVWWIHTWKVRSCLLEQLANYVVKPKSKSKVVILRTNHTSRLWSNFVNQSVRYRATLKARENWPKRAYRSFIFHCAICLRQSIKEVMSCQSTRKIAFNVDRKSPFFSGINTVASTFSFLDYIFRWFSH